MCCAEQCRTMPCCAILHHSVPCQAVPCCAMPSRAIPCQPGPQPGSTAAPGESVSMAQLIPPGQGASPPRCPPAARPGYRRNRGPGCPSPGGATAAPWSGGHHFVPGCSLVAEGPRPGVCWVLRGCRGSAGWAGEGGSPCHPPAATCPPLCPPWRDMAQRGVGVSPLRAGTSHL